MASTTDEVRNRLMYRSNGFKQGDQNNSMKKLKSFQLVVLEELDIHIEKKYISHREGNIIYDGLYS